MKRLIALLLAIVMTALLFASCGEQKPDPITPDDGSGSGVPDDVTPPSQGDTSDKDANEPSRPTSSVVITTDPTLSGNNQDPSIPDTTTPGTTTPGTTTPGTTTPGTTTPGTTTPGTTTPGTTTPGTTTPGTTTPGTSTTGYSTPKNPVPLPAGVKQKSVYAANDATVRVGFFGDGFFYADTINYFGALCWEDGIHIPNFAGNSWPTVNDDATYSIYELFSWNGTKADSKITKINNDNISFIFDKDSTPVDYYVAMVSRDRAIVTTDGEGRSITAYKKINELLKAQNPNGKLVLVVPPPYAEGCGFFQKKFSMKNIWGNEHDALIKAFANKLVAAIPDAIVIQAGDAYSFFQKNYASSGFNLYREDLRNPSEAGAYYVACLIYSTLFGKSPYGMEFSGYMTNEDATVIQQAAHEFIFGSKPTSANAHKTVVPPQIIFYDDPRYTNETYPENWEALFVTAMAYYERRGFVQYDQISNDRISKAQYRRTLEGAPEDGTPQNTLFLDCTAFVWATLKTAFNYELPEQRSRTLTYNDLPGNIVVFETNAMSGLSQEGAANAFREVLQPGDVIAYSNPDNTRGHGYLYLGNGYLIQCSSASRLSGGSADFSYTGKYDAHEGHGGIVLQKEDMTTDPLSPAYQFDPKHNMTIRIIRPDYSKLTPTEDTVNRVKNLQHIVAYKETSAPTGVSVNPGGTVDITVVLKNVGIDSKTVQITDTLPAGLTLKSGNNNFSVTLAPGETKRTTYTVQVASTAALGTTIAYKTTKAGGVTLNDTSIYVNKTLTAAEQASVVSAAKAATGAKDSCSLVSAAYAGTGITLPFTSAQTANTGIFKADAATASSNGVAVNTASANYEMLVPGLYGGQKVVVGSDATNKIKDFRPHNLVAGDIITVSESSGYQLYLYLGGSTIMYVKDGKVATVNNSSACLELMERIFAEDSFAVYRPSFAK